MNHAHDVVSREEWLDARKALLAREKAFSRARDEMSQQIRSLPWVKVEKDYGFTGEQGAVSLGDLFDGRSQLITYHFMLGPGWSEGCKSCSLLADHFERLIVHLKHRDTSMVCISSGPLENLLAFRQRMGWTFDWYSSGESDFNQDFNVTFSPYEVEQKSGDYNFGKAPHGTELPGLSVFKADDSGTIYHTYSTYGRGLEDFMGVYRLLDVVPKGRDEDDLNYGMEWVKHRDSY